MPKRVSNQLAPNAVKSIVEPGYHLDGRGLYLQVSKAGTKSWVFAYMRDGRSREMGLGSADDVPLARAREKAAACRQQLADGVDPIDSREAVKEATRLAAARHKTFRECAA